MDRPLADIVSDLWKQGLIDQKRKERIVSEFHKLGAVEGKVSRKLMEHLLGAYNLFLEKQGEAGLSTMDALMGVHNFYKFLVMHWEEPEDRDGSQVLRNVVVSTLQKALLEPEEK